MSMNEFLRSDEMLTDEEIVLCAEAARLWEEERVNEERNYSNGNIHRKRK